MVGTPGFLAPEIEFESEFLGQYPNAPDVWCLGEMTCRLLASRPVFRSRQDFRQYHEGHIQFPITHLERLGISDCASCFIAATMNANPVDRVTAEEAINHRWLLPLQQDSTTSELHDTGSR